MGAALGRQATCLLARRPDVLALQEVTLGSYGDWQRKLRSEGYEVVSSVELVAAPYPAPPYPSPPFPRRVRGHIKRKYFNLTAARHPVELLPGLHFAEPDEALYAFPEKYVAARVSVGGREVEVHNAHLPPGASRGLIKVHAFEAIARRLAESSIGPKILCGDFNAPWSEDAGGPVSVLRRKWPEDIAARWLKAEQVLLSHPLLRDVYRDVHVPGRPFPASHITGRTPHRYDYIFATPDLSTGRCKYLVEWLDNDKPQGRLSDHAPVEAELSFATET
jgi:endonuclease/exonuclease/phosphatase family metal-dependent hydrolase